MTIFGDKDLEPIQVGEAPKPTMFGDQTLQDQLEALDGDTAPAPQVPQVPFRFRDTSGETPTETLRASGQHNMQALMGLTKDPAQTMKAIGMLFSKDGLEALGEFYKQSYGGVEEAKATARKDPMGFLSDIAMIGTPMRAAGKIGGMPRLNTAGAIMENLDPATAAGAAARTSAGQGLSAIPATNPEAIYENLLKMPVTPTSKYRKRGVRSAVIDTLLKNKISPTGAGVDKKNTLVARLSDDLDALIDAADKKGTRVPASQMYGRLEGLRRVIQAAPGYPERAEDLATITGYLRRWKKSTGDVTSFSPSEARQLRQMMDDKINWNNIPTIEPPMKRQMREEAAHGMRGAIADAVPEAQSVNKEITALLDAAEPLERATARLGNNNQSPLANIVGVGSGAGVAGLGAATDSTVLQIIGMMQAGKHLVWTPKNKARAAQLIYQDRNLANPVKRNMIRMLLSQSTRQEQQAREQMGATE